MTEFERNTYGISEGGMEMALKSQYVKDMGIANYVANMLSLTLVKIEHGSDMEEVCKMLNRAKFFLSKIDEKEEA